MVKQQRCRQEITEKGYGAEYHVGASPINTESQLVALEKAKLDKEAHGEFDSEHPGYCLAQDTFYVGTLKGVGRVYQQTVIDTYSKVGFAKLCTRKTPLTAADILNDRVIPFFDEQGIRIDRMLTDRGTEYCGAHDRHEYKPTFCRDFPAAARVSPAWLLDCDNGCNDVTMQGAVARCPRAPAQGCKPTFPGWTADPSIEQ